MKPPSPSRLVAIDAQTFIKGIVKVPDLCDAMREDEAGVQKIIDGYNEYSGHDHVTVDLLRTSSDVQERVYFWLRGNGLRESRTAEKAIAKTKKIETAVRSANAIVTGTQTRDELCESTKTKWRPFRDIVTGYNADFSNISITTDDLRSSSEIQKLVYAWLKRQGFKERKVIDKTIV